MEGKTYIFVQDIQFVLEDGIKLSNESEEPNLISAVKNYPSGYMIDGLGILEINDSD